MTFDDAVAAHVKWKVHLTLFIRGTGTVQFNSAIVCQDHLCELGKWLHGKGAKYKTNAPYRNLMEKHAALHACAGAMVKKVEEGDRAGANTVMKGTFTDASEEVVGAIAQLREAVANDNRKIL